MLYPNPRALLMLALQIGISRFDMSYAQAHWVGSKSLHRVMQLKLHKPTMAIGYLLLVCARHVDSTNPGPSNLVFRKKTDTRSRDVESAYCLPHFLHLESGLAKIMIFFKKIKKSDFFYLNRIFLI